MDLTDSVEKETCSTAPPGPPLRIQATILEVLGELLTLYFIVKEAYQNRKILLRIAKTFIRITRWVSVKSLGVGASFLGGMILIATPLAGWQYFHTLGMYSASAFIPSIIGVIIGTEIFAFIGIAILGGGVCALAPRSTAARFFRSNLFNRKKAKKRDGTPYPARSVFGLFLRNTKK